MKTENGRERERGRKRINILWEEMNNPEYKETNEKE